MWLRDRVLHFAIASFKRVNCVSIYAGLPGLLNPSLITKDDLDLLLYFQNKRLYTVNSLLCPPGGLLLGSILKGGLIGEWA